MWTRILRALMVAALVGCLALSPAASRADETPPGDARNPGQPGLQSDGSLGDPGAAEAFFDDLVSRQLRKGHVAGATVAVVEDGRVVFAKGCGYADLEERERVVAGETLFFPGSAGKLFTWTAVMQLAEEGRLDLDADVNEYLDFRIPDAGLGPITMSHLMTHTAGFEEEYAAQLAGDRDDVLPPREFLLRHMPKRVYRPDEVYAYSNYGTALAGYVVERVSGEPYERYVEEHILKPLGMEHSAAVQPLPPNLARDLSKGYHYRDGSYDASSFEWVSNAPSAPVHATATDMAKFMLVHLQNGAYGSGRILEKDTALEMHRRQFTHAPSLPGTAYGFINSRANGRRLLLHDGESARFSSLVALLPDENAGLFVSYNTPHEPYEILSAFMDRFYPARENETSRAPREAPGIQTDRWTGTYVPARVAHTSPQKIVGWLDPLKVRSENGRLLVDSPLGRQRYVATGPDTFEQAEGEWSLVFREHDGKARLFMGPFPLAYFEVPVYQTLGFQLPLAVACLALFLSALLVYPVGFLVRRLRKGSTPARLAVTARWLAVVAGALNLALVTWFGLVLAGFGETYVWPTGVVSIITRLWLLSLPLALGVAVLAVLAWRNRYWGVASRLHYTLVALAAIVFVVLLGNWNLIGP